MPNYQSFIQKNPDAPSRQVGPVQSSTNVRTITVTDFAPDVCKDYKQTGFCGFGDSCKYLHARESYKQGWELDRDWEVGTKGKKLQGKTVASANRSAQDGSEDQDDEALLESIPFACIICKKPYKHPVVTKCGHYFCEACALQRYRKNPSCAACGAGTGGVFNVARKLSKLLDKKRQRAKKRKEEALAKGEEVRKVTMMIDCSRRTTTGLRSQNLKHDTLHTCSKEFADHNDQINLYGYLRKTLGALAAAAKAAKGPLERLLRPTRKPRLVVALKRRCGEIQSIVTYAEFRDLGLDRSTLKRDF